MSLIEIASDLWVASQPLRFIGLDLGSRMTVVRLPNRELVLISPIELSELDCQQLDQLGPVRHIIAPNLFHHLSVGSTHARYPEATVWGVEGLPQKRPDLTFDQLLTESGSFENTLDYLPVKGFASILPQGIKLANETVFFHRPSRTLILTDTAFNFDQNDSLSIRLLAKAVGSYQKLKPSLLEKLGTRDKKAVAESIQQVLTWDFDRVIPGHGSIVETDGKAALRSGYEWFLDRELSF